MKKGKEKRVWESKEIQQIPSHRKLVIWCFNSDRRCEAGNYKREARLEGKAEKEDAVVEKQGRSSRICVRRKWGAILEKVMDSTIK